MYCLVSLVVKFGCYKVYMSINNPRAEGARENFRSLLNDLSEKLVPAVPIGAAGENFLKNCRFFGYFRRKFYPFFPPGGGFPPNPPLDVAALSRWREKKGPCKINFKFCK